MLQPLECKNNFVLGNGELVKQLIKRGINVSATNNEGNTPMLLAASWGKELKSKQSHSQNNFKKICLLGHDIVVQLLIEHGSNVSAVNNDGNTALHLSASEGDKIENRKCHLYLFKSNWNEFVF